MPGQTFTLHRASQPPRRRPPSMEGRAIARPNRVIDRQRRRPHRDWVPFNGGPGNCPAKPAPSGFGHLVPTRVLPSMEGRAIARPNSGPAPQLLQGAPSMEAGQLPGQPGDVLHQRGRRYPFNGGPGNCPAKPHRSAVETSSRRRSRVPSMEGRAIARPNPGQSKSSHTLNRMITFNGGPGNCPAKPLRLYRCHRRVGPFNGGPGNCPAKQHWGSKSAGVAMSGRPSMEGRAIARPNTNSSDLQDRGDARLQWRAGQLPGQT